MNFRGAAVEDLNLPPCDAIFPSTKLADVHGIVLERSCVVPPIVPVFGDGKVVGYLSAQQIDSINGNNETEVVGNHLTPGTAERATVSTSIENLLELFGSFPVVEVWDASCSYLLSTVTEHDCSRFTAQCS